MAATSSGQLTLTESVDRSPCAECGQPFDAAYPDQKYCSRECYHASTRQRVTATCDYCGESREVPPWEAENRDYCSRDCAFKSQRDRELLTCDQCDETFEERPSIAHRRRYCSRECYAASKRKQVELECDRCGDSFSVWESEAEERRFCSRKCYKAHNERRVRWECEYCGEGQELRPSEADRRKYCSRSCSNRGRASHAKDDSPTEPEPGPELTRGQIEIAIENGTVGIQEAKAQPLPGGGGSVRMAVDRGAMSIDAEELTADVGETDPETVENALAAWADATDMVSLPTAAVDAVNHRREELNEQFGLDLPAVEDVGRAPPEAEPDGCDHLEQYTVAGSCMRCEEYDPNPDLDVRRELTADSAGAKI